jgi:hypothetical protein
MLAGFILAQLSPALNHLSASPTKHLFYKSSPGFVWSRFISGETFVLVWPRFGTVSLSSGWQSKDCTARN